MVENLKKNWRMKQDLIYCPLHSIVHF